MSAMESEEVPDFGGRPTAPLSKLQGAYSTGRRPLSSGVSVGTYGGMDDKIKAIEGRLGGIETEQRTHFRWTVTIGIALIAAFITGFGIMLARTDRTEDKIARLEERVGRLETGVAELPGKISQSLLQLNQTLLQAIIAGSSMRAPPQVPQSPSGSEPTVPR
jgi:hypothetical protein